MLDLIEHTNREIVYLMGLSFTMGIMASVVLFVCPVQAALDTLKRNTDQLRRQYRDKS